MPSAGLEKTYPRPLGNVALVSFLREIFGFYLRAAPVLVSTSLISSYVMRGARSSHCPSSFS